MDNGNNRSVPFIVQCGHCADAEIIIEQQPGKAPMIYFGALPHAGLMVLTNQTVMLACRNCARDVGAVNEIMKLAIEMPRT